MEMTSQQVQRIATLARLGISDAEIESIRIKLNSILALVDQMQAQDTTVVQPLAHPTAFVSEVALRLREDKVTEPSDLATRDRNMVNTPVPAQNGMFIVPRVIE